MVSIDDHRLPIVAPLGSRTNCDVAERAEFFVDRGRVSGLVSGSTCPKGTWAAMPFTVEHIYQGRSDGSVGAMAAPEARGELPRPRPEFEVAISGDGLHVFVVGRADHLRT